MEGIWSKAYSLRRRAPDMASGALHGALLSLEDDSASLSRRFRATQELRRLLADLVDGDPVACRICYGRRAPSLLVAMMDEFGEDRDATRNDILGCLASLVRFVPGEELASDPRLWALLMRMMYQRDNESVLHAQSWSQLWDSLLWRELELASVLPPGVDALLGDIDQAVDGVAGDQRENLPIT